MQAIEITQMNGNTEGRTYTARDAAHADRMIERLKAALPAGSSTWFRRGPAA